jgi:hypothetical protein
MAHARKIITHDIQLNLSTEEAEIIKLLVGALSAGEGNVGSIYDELDRIGIDYSGKKLSSGHDRLPVFCLHIEKK